MLAALGALVVSVFVVFRFPPDHYAIYPRCPFYSLFGVQCPGCGATRALSALLRGHFSEAVRHNLLLVTLAPIAAVILGFEAYSALRWNRWRPLRIPSPAVIGVAVAGLLFGLVRDLTHYL